MQRPHGHPDQHLNTSRRDSGGKRSGWRRVIEVAALRVRKHSGSRNRISLTVSGTNADDDAPKVTLVLGSTSINESGTGNSTTVSARLSRAATAPTAITPTAPAGTTLDATRLTIDAGETSSADADTAAHRQVTLTAVDNDVDAADRMVSVTGSASNAVSVADPAPVSLTIADDDTAGLTVSKNSVSTSEPNGRDSFTVKLDTEPTATVTVTIGVTGGDTDEAAVSPATLKFAAEANSGNNEFKWDDPRQVTVTGQDDSASDGDRSYTITVAAASTDANYNALSKTVSGLNADDDVPRVTLVLSETEIAESGEFNSTTISARLDRASTASTTITVTAPPGTRLSGTTLTIDAGETFSFNADTAAHRRVTLTAVDNGLDAADRVVTVTGTAVNSATVSGPAGVSLTITDEDTARLEATTVRLPLRTSEAAGPPVSIRVRLQSQPTATVTLSIRSSDTGEATVTPSTLKFAATADIRDLDDPVYEWNVPREVTVKGVDDLEDDNHQSFTITVTAASADTKYHGQSLRMSGVNLDDDDPEVKLSLSDDSISENGGTTDVSAALTEVSHQTVTITFIHATGAYTVPSDANTITIEAGETKSTDRVTLTAVDNTTDSPDRSGTVRGISSPRAEVVGAELTLEDDDDAPTVTLAVADNTIKESSGTASETMTTVSATLSHASSEDTTITVTPVSGAYTVGSDATITIAAGETENSSDTVSITAVNNTRDEPDRSVTVTGSAANSHEAGSVTGASLTITDDDAAPSITLTVDDNSVGEGDGATTITVTATLDGTTRFAEATTVTVSVAGSGTAGAVDFGAVTDFDIEIAAGAASNTGSFTLTPTDDALDETDETVTVSGASGSLTVNPATISLTDNDGAPSLSINSPSVTEGDSGSTTLTFTVTLSPASGQQVTAAYADAGTGTATSGTDYAAIAGGTLTFAVGTTSRTFDVSVTGDATDEANETVVVSLSGATNATISTASGTGTITDDDDAPTLSIDSPSVTEGDSGSTNLTFTVTLSAASGRQVTVDWAEGTGGTATSGTDYTAITGGTLTFTAGTTSRTFDVSVTGDTTDEADETVVVTLSNAGNATIGTATGTGTITDDDAAPTVSIDSPSVTEGDSGSKNLTFTVTLSAASGQQVTVDYADAGTGTATSGTDYTAITGGTLTFAAGTTSRTFDVSVTGDTLAESNETVVVSLSNAANATISMASRTGTITNDDGPVLSVNSPSVTEGDSGSANLTFTATLSAASGQQVTVDWAEGTGGTATSGTDYTAIIGGTLTFAAGTTSRAFNVSVTGDTTDEADETVVVTLSNAANATIGTATGTGTITDDDGAPTVSIDSPSVMEGDSGSADLTFTVTLSAASGRQVTVGYADAGTGTATSGADYTAIPAGTLTFAPGTTSQTIAVTVTGDATDEANETVVVTLSAPVNATLAAAAGTGTVTNDDADLRVETTGPGTTTRTVNGRTVTVVVGDGVPAGVVVLLPVALDRDVVLRFAPPAPGVPFESARFGLGETPDRRTVVDVTAQPVPSGGLELCLPVAAALHAEAGGRGLRLLHYGASGWAPVARSRDDAARGLVCASGVTALSPFAVGYGDLKPTFGEAAVAPQRYREGTEIDPLVLPAATGGDGPLAYALAPASPEGLEYTAPADATSGGTLAGTPTVPAQAAAWTLTATDADGDTATLTFTVEVAPDLMPSFGDAQVPPQRYVQDLEIAPLALPAATGGDGPLAYALAPALPEGLEYTAPADATSGGTLAGTPTVPAQAAAWTLTATDADGDTATLTFTVEVAPDLAPSFGDAQVPPQRYVQGLEIAPLALPAATGGNGPLAYALAPALPEGLEYTAPADATSGGALAGTPTVPAQAAAWTLTATDADGDTATLTFTIEVLDRLRVRLKGINEALLPDLSRAMTASTMDAVSGRIGQALSGDGAGAHGAMASADVLTGLAGLLQANEQALEDGTWSWKQGLDGRRFALALSGDGAGGRDGVGGGAAPGLGAGPATGAGARVTAWGAGDYRSLAGGEGSAVGWDGHLFGAHLGMDTRFGAGGLAGLALSVSKGRFDYTDTSVYALGETVEGEYESRMTSVHPYVGWAWPAGRHAWASLGYGRGDVTLLDGEAGRQTSDSRLRSAAAGGSVRVLSGEGPGVFGPMTVDLKGEAWTTRLAVEDNGERIAGLAVRTHRLRVAAEGARAFALGGGAAFTPSVELGMRFDRGDGETGAGVELGGGLDYAHPALGLSADVAGRVLLAHEGATEDWSVGGAVRLEPASGLGPSLRLAPSYGDTGSGLSRLWEHGVAGSGAGATGAGTTGASPAARLDTEMGYGLAAFAGVLTPYGGLTLSEGGTRGYRLGARFLLGPAFELGLEGDRRENGTDRAEHGLMLRGRIRW